MKSDSQEKLNILKDLVVDEKHSLEDLRRLVEKSKPFLKIENKSGKIIISSDFPFTINEKLVIYLIGRYFVKELGLDDETQITSRNISDNIDIAQTTISGPLGDFVRKKIIEIKENSYSIKYYEIENQLDTLTDKYLIKQNTTVKATLKRKKTKTSSGRSKRKKLIKPAKDKASRIVDEESLEKELKKHNLTLNNFYSVFNINDGRIILIRGGKGSSDRETHVRGTLLFLTGNKLLYGLDEIDSSELRNALIDSGLPMKNHSTTLKSYSIYVIHKRGPIGSTKTSYRITSIGIQKGITLLKDIVENTSNFDLVFKQKVRIEKAEKIEINNEELKSGIDHFVKQNSINEDKLRTLFDFQNNGVRICNPLKENTRKILQIKTLMLLGILLKKVYDVSSFSGKDILKNSRITYDRLDLLDKNKHYRNYFSLKPKSAMQLTYAGEKKALEMLKEYLEKGECKL